MMSLTFSMKISSFIDMQNVRFHFDLVPFAKQNKLFWFVFSVFSHETLSPFSKQNKLFWYYEGL